MDNTKQRGRDMEAAAEYSLDGFLSKLEVLGAIGNPSTSTFDALRRSGGFPVPVKLSPTARRVFWRASEIRAWMAARQRG